MVVVSLQRRPLGLGVFVSDGGLAQQLPRGLVLVQVDPGLLAVSVHLDLAHRGEVLDQLGHLGTLGQTLDKDLDLGADTRVIRTALLEFTAASSSSSSASPASSRSSSAPSSASSKAPASPTSEASTTATSSKATTTASSKAPAASTTVHADHLKRNYVRYRDDWDNLSSNFD